jgi:hypothetical protein
MYHKNHSLSKGDLKYLLKIGKNKIISNNQKLGEYDLYKYCPNCDGVIFNEFESYTRSILYSKNLNENERFTYKESPGFIECSNINYESFKLFFLSILFRADISERELFSHINLGHRRNELREMILNKNPKSDIDYPILFLDTFFDPSISHDFIFQPVKMKIGEEDGYMFAFGGLIVFYGFSLTSVPITFREYRIKADGTLKILHIPPGQTWELINQWYNK